MFKRIIFFIILLSKRIPGSFIEISLRLNCDHEDYNGFCENDKLYNCNIKN